MTQDSVTSSPRFHLPNLKSLPFGGASSISDPDLVAIIRETICRLVDDGCLDNTEVQEKFVCRYRDWIGHSNNNSFLNLDQWSVLAFSNGTTEAFDKFYINNHLRRFRICRGEYMYHGAVWKNSNPNWAYIEDAPLQRGDAVIISLPFSDTGTVHKDLDKILCSCMDLDVPVLVDCAFIGICGNIEFDFGHPAITELVFSLSKAFPVANLRIGMRAQRKDNDDGLLVYQKTNYTNRLGAALGLWLIEHYNVDYNYNKYRKKQLEFCSQLNVCPSDSVIFGIGDHEWQHYNRGGDTNRLCFSKWFSQHGGLHT
jgi:hypothetical protein